MCIAILKPRSKKLLKEHLENSWHNNPHGAGFMYPSDGKIAVVKELNDFESFYNKYKYIEDAEVPMVIHFRLATHGKKDLDNCHPFLINDSVGFVHNGIISGVGTSSDKSDTNLFRDKLVKLGLTDIPNKVMHKLISGFVGQHNKLIFLNKDGKATIVSESAGSWKDGVWYSNTGYLYSYKNHRQPRSWTKKDFDYGINEMEKKKKNSYVKPLNTKEKVLPKLAGLKSSMLITTISTYGVCDLCELQARVNACVEYVSGQRAETFNLCATCQNLY